MLINYNKNILKINRLKIKLRGELEMKDLGVVIKYWAWRFIKIEKQENCTYYKKVHQESVGMFCNARVKANKHPIGNSL